mmetsp:Transcript_23218/g.92113  ORF Transcript_23218/g.92113 Transcript_23218/m.92113 type:complete len:226 (-) Transcript_23218:105-782(-)
MRGDLAELRDEHVPRVRDHFRERHVARRVSCVCHVGRRAAVVGRRNNRRSLLGRRRRSEHVDRTQRREHRGERCLVDGRAVRAAIFFEEHGVCRIVAHQHGVRLDDGRGRRSRRVKGFGGVRVAEDRGFHERAIRVFRKVLGIEATARQRAVRVARADERVEGRERRAVEISHFEVVEGVEFELVAAHREPPRLRVLNRARVDALVDEIGLRQAGWMSTSPKLPT